MEATFVVGINLLAGVPTTLSVQLSLQTTGPLNHYPRNTLIETIRPKICSKLWLKCAKSALPVDVHRQKNVAA